MRTRTMDVLLKMGMPARIKGLTYICDAVELFDTDPYYPDGKICTLYCEIADKHNTTATSVERAIRHAFETTLAKGDTEILEHYLDITNTQNSNLLRSLYFRMRQEIDNESHHEGCDCDLKNCVLKEQFSQEAMVMFCRELAKAFAKQMESM